MYYDRDMKKTFLVSCLCLWAGLAAAQTPQVVEASTCETRVDAHQRASTKQRVVYCLTPEYNANYPANPGLLFSGVSSPRVRVDPVLKGPTAREGFFDKNGVGINNVYVETRTFPRLTDGRVSVQEQFQKAHAAEDAEKMAQEMFSHTPCCLNEQDAVEPPPAPVNENPGLEILGEEVAVATETKSGVRTRTNKPGRRWNQPEPVAAVPGAAAVEEGPVQEVASAPTAGSYTYDEAYSEYEPYVPVEVSAQPYAPAEAYEIPVGTSSYAPAGQQEIPVGTSSYAPAQ